MIDRSTDIRAALEQRRSRQRGFIMTPYGFGAPAPTDPDYADVVALVHGQSATDNGPLGLTVTNSGTTLNSSGVTPKFGASGSCFVGSTQSSGSKFVSIAHDAGFTPAGDFTIEMWVYLTNNATFQVFTYKAAGTGLSPFELYVSGGGKLGFFGSKADGSALYNIIGTTTMSANAWHFVQGRRSGNVFACALDSTQEATVTASGGLWSNGDAVSVGNFASGSASNILGYFQDFRFTNGVARAFAVPTDVFPNS